MRKIVFSFMFLFFMSSTCHAVNPYFYHAGKTVDWQSIYSNTSFAADHVSLKDRTYVDVWVKNDNDTNRSLVLYHFDIVKKTVCILDSVYYNADGSLNNVSYMHINYGSKKYPKDINMTKVLPGSFENDLLNTVCDPTRRALYVSNDFGTTPLPVENERKWYYMTSLCNNTWEYVDTYRMDKNRGAEFWSVYYDKQRIDIDEDMITLWLRCRHILTVYQNDKGIIIDTVYSLQKVAFYLHTGRYQLLEGYNFDASGNLLGTAAEIKNFEFIPNTLLENISLKMKKDYKLK